MSLIDPIKLPITPSVEELTQTLNSVFGKLVDQLNNTKTTSDFNANNHRITNVGWPTQLHDAVNIEYLKNLKGSGSRPTKTSPSDVWITLSPMQNLAGAGSDLVPPLRVILGANGNFFRCVEAIAQSKLGSVGVMDVLYKPVGGVYTTIFDAGIDIDNTTPPVFDATPMDIPNNSEIRLDCTSITPETDDIITVQIRGRVY